MTNINYSDLKFRFIIVDNCENEEIYNDKNSIEFKIKKSSLKKLLDTAFNTINTPLNVSLTKRENEVLKHLVEGLNNSEIASKLNITVHTVKAHIHNIYTKLSVQGRIEAVVKAVKGSLIDI